MISIWHNIWLSKHHIAWTWCSELFSHGGHLSTHGGYLHRYMVTYFESLYSLMKLPSVLFCWPLLRILNPWLPSEASIYQVIFTFFYMSFNRLQYCNNLVPLSSIYTRLVQNYQETGALLTIIPFKNFINVQGIGYPNGRQASEENQSWSITNGKS